MTTKMSMTYNVLWIDDEWDKMTTFQQECEEIYGLHLEPFRTRKAGMEAYERDIEHWDAVLLDAKMFDEGENEVAALSGFKKAIQRLDELSLKRTIPRFISTGQPDLMSDNTFKQLYDNFYKKGVDDVKLINDMLAAIANCDNQHVKKIYQDVFNAIGNLGIAKYTESILMEILVPMHYPGNEPNFKPSYHYNKLRQMIEYLFRVCNKFGIVPDQCITDGKVNLTMSSLYLAGKDAEKIGVRYGVKGDRIIPDYIENIIRSVLDFGNVHSHTVELNDEDTLKIEKILVSAKSRYIIFGLTLQLCEAIVWLSEYISKHNDKEANLSMCNRISCESNSIESAIAKYENKVFVVEKDKKNNYHCGQCRLSYNAAKDYLGLSVMLYDVKENKAKSLDNYPYFAKFKVKK